ncbi:MAG: efflux RND transporter periplasmic adaptor subunit [Magnetococcales bacterium]|nr:efflux RND transporter periplasmic adaptor subunit [Magnetococcales bacterium]
MRASFFFILSVVLLLPLPNPLHAENTPAPLVVVSATLEKPAQPHAAIPGTVIPLLESTLASRVNGFVVSTPFQVGDRVEAGADLVMLESLDSQREKQIQQAVIAEAAAHLSRARNNLARDKKLQNTPALSRQRLADRTAEVAIKAAILNRAKARLNQIQDQLSWHRMTAPFSGIITEKRVSPGEWITAGQGVVTVLDPTQLEVEALIPATVADSLSVGVTAQATFPKQSQTSVATLRALLPRQNPISRNRPSYWTLEQPHQAIAGESVSLTIPLGEKATMVLALKDAIIRQGKGSLVFVVDTDTIRAAPVQLGPSVGHYFQIREGLQAGEQVVVRGNERVRPGQKVRPIQLTGADTVSGEQSP